MKKDLLKEFHTQIKNVNSLANNLDQALNLFEAINHKTLKESPSELGFVYLIAYLYILYFESGKVNLDYIIEKMDVYNGESGIFKSHIKEVNNFRTFLFHNLDESKKKDRPKVLDCKMWYQDVAGVQIPFLDNHWEKCFNKMLDDNQKLIRAVTKCLKSIQVDPMRDYIIEEWKFKVESRIEKHECYDLVVEVSSYLYKRVNVEKLLNDKFSNWKKELKYEKLSSKSEYLIEMKKVIEKDLIKEVPKRLPLTGSDLIDILNVKPGPQIGEILKYAAELWIVNDEFTKAELLEKIKCKFNL